LPRHYGRFEACRHRGPKGHVNSIACRQSKTHRDFCRTNFGYLADRCRSHGFVFKLSVVGGSGTNYTEFVVQPQAGNITYTLPADDGDPGEVLSTDGSGVLDWIASAASFNYGLHIAVPQIAYRL